MFKASTTRIFPYPVTVYTRDAEGKEVSGTFTAKFRILPSSQKPDQKLLERVLVGVSDLELSDEAGTALSESETLKAAKQDPEISLALVTAYNEAIGKKNLSRT